MNLLVVLLLVLGVHGADRMCCRYRCSPETGECPSWCKSAETCTILNGTEMVSDEGCRVVHDSKKDQSDIASKEDCLKRNYKSRKSFDFLPFYLEPYVYRVGDGQIPFTGLNLRYEYNTFQKLRFRYKNTNINVCPERPGLFEDLPCNPRCVEIDRTQSKPTPGLLENMSYLSYDCEAGFYISGKQTWTETTGDDYLLSVCAELQDTANKICGDYSFQMPAAKDVENTTDPTVILLVDRQEFENRDKIVIYVPNTQKADKLSISLLVVSESLEKSEIYSKVETIPNGVHSPLKIVVDHNIPSGRYQVAVTPMRGGVLVGSPSYSSYIIRPNIGEHAGEIIIAVFSIIIVVGLILGVRKHWQQVAEDAAVEPRELVEAGRIQPKPLLVITSLDNVEHAQIVKDLCVYLRDWCGVGDTLYPLDDQHGVSCSQAGPWKWAQNGHESVKESGYILFIAGPKPSVLNHNSVYPGLQDNQAFLVTQDLRRMHQEGRVLVARLPYSDLKTIPTEVPEQLVNSALLLPKQMNSLLVRLLQVRKKTLCRWIPFSLVQPKISPHDLTRTGGPEILKRIRELTIKDNLRLDEAVLSRNSMKDRLLQYQTTEDESPKEKFIADEKQREHSLLLSPGAMADTAVLDIKLEANMPSLKDMANRDRTLAEDV